MPEPVLVLVVQPPPGGLGAAGGEALGAGREVASQLGAPLECAIAGDDTAEAATEAAERGAGRVLVVEAPHLARFSGDATVEAAAAAVRAAAARIVLVARGPDSLELVPRLAARLDGASVMGVTEVRPTTEGDVEVVAAVFGGAARAVYRFGTTGPRVLGPAAAIAEAPEREPGREVERLSLDVTPPASERVWVLEPAAAPEGPRLEDARIVVTGGRGLGDGEHYGLIRDLAAALGGMAGASRAIVDEYWAEPAEQVGLTGAVVTPDLYLAFGVSGASQHMMGCSNARLIVAVNTDPEAPIFRYAHLGIVDDCLEVLPEMIRAARERRGGG